MTIDWYLLLLLSDFKICCKATLLKILCKCYEDRKTDKYNRGEKEFRYKPTNMLSFVFQ